MSNTTYHILPFKPPKGLWLIGTWCGRVYVTSFILGKALYNLSKTKDQQHSRAPPHVFEAPYRQFDYIHIDIVGPLPSSQGYTHLLTRWTTSPDSQKQFDWRRLTPRRARSLVFHWFACFGMPLDMTSDRVSQFKSKLWSTVTMLLGIKLHCTTAYTIHRQMALWNDFTDAWNRPSQHNSLAQTA